MRRKTCLRLPVEEVIDGSSRLFLISVLRLLDRLRLVRESESELSSSDEVELEDDELEEEDDDEDDELGAEDDEDAEDTELRRLLGRFDGSFDVTSVSVSSLLEEDEDEEESESESDEAARVLVFLWRFRRGLADALLGLGFDGAILSWISVKRQGVFVVLSQKL